MPHGAHVYEYKRIPIVQRMILADDPEERQQALDELLPMQKEDFKGIFRAMDGLPVNIRLLGSTAASNSCRIWKTCWWK